MGGVDDLDARWRLDVPGGDVALALGGQVEGLRAIDLDAQDHALEVEDDVDYVLDDPARDRLPGDPGQQGATQGVTERVPEPRLERFHDEPRTVLVDYVFFDLR